VTRQPAHLQSPEHPMCRTHQHLKPRVSLRRTQSKSSLHKVHHLRLLTSAPVSTFQTFTRWSSDPLTMRLPSREKEADLTESVCPVSVQTCHPTPTSSDHFQCENCSQLQHKTTPITRPQWTHSLKAAHRGSGSGDPDDYEIVERRADDAFAVGGESDRAHAVRVTRQRAQLPPTLISGHFRSET